MRRKLNKTEKTKRIAGIAAAAILMILVLAVSQIDNVKAVKAGSKTDVLKTQQIQDMSSVVLQQGKDRSNIIVNWLTTKEDKYKVQYYKRDQAGFATKYIEVVMNDKEGSGKDVYCYTAELENLEPNTRYGYRIDTADGSAKGEEYYFKTPPGQGLFSFLFMGDAQIGAGDKKQDTIGWERALNIGDTAVPNAAFVLSAGDQVDSSKYDTAINQYFSFRSPGLLKEIPIATVRGNHEEENDLYDLQFKAPGQSSGRDYYFQYDETLFICIDSNDEEYDEHREFMKDAIKSTSHQWIVVMMHHPVFGGAADTDKIKELRKQYVPFFSDMDVDLVLSGHEHLYARSFIMDGTEVTDKKGGVKTKGQTMYLAAGSSSGSKYDNEGAELPDYIAYAQPKFEAYVTGIEISGKELIISTYSTIDLKKIDSCVLKK